jgi:hypothetical protein
MPLSDFYSKQRVERDGETGFWMVGKRISFIKGLVIGLTFLCGHIWGERHRKNKCSHDRWEWKGFFPVISSQP